jgi:hypothetical protein
VRLVDANGLTIGSYGGGFAQDAAGERAQVVTSLVGQQGGTVEVRESVDASWWADPARVFPVTVDPIFVAQTTASGALDTYISSDAPSTGHASSTVVQVGHRSTGVDRGLLKWDLSGLAVPGQVVLSSQLWVNSVGGASCTARKMDVFNVTGTWGSGVTWATRPSVASSPLSSATFAHGFSGSCPAGVGAFDVTSVVQGWVNSGATNNGLELQADAESDSLSRWDLASAESGNGPPSLIVTVDHLPTNATLIAPANEASVPTATPTLTASPGTDVDGDALTYRFVVSTDPDAQVGGVYATDFTSATSFTVPSGVLQDGMTYYWTR